MTGGSLGRSFGAPQSLRFDRLARFRRDEALNGRADLAILQQMRTHGRLPAFVARSLGPVIRSFWSSSRDRGVRKDHVRLFPDHRYVSLDAPDRRTSFAADPRSIPGTGDIRRGAACSGTAHLRQGADRCPTAPTRPVCAHGIPEHPAHGACVGDVRRSGCDIAPFSQQGSRFRGRSPASVEADYLPGFGRNILRGGYEVASLNRDFVLWQRSYMQTYVERDRTLRQVGLDPVSRLQRAAGT